MSRSPSTLCTGLDFGEGPRWHDGRLWYSDFYRHGVFAVGDDGVEERILTVDGQPSGLGWMPDGTLLVVSMTDQRVLRVGSGGVSVHADLAGVARHHCNDMVVSSSGVAYVGCFGFALDEDAPFAPAPLFGVRPDGEVFVAADELRFPNGSVITPDGGTLVVGETFGGRYRAFDIGADGTLHGERVWAEVPGSAPDGCCLDADGAIWMADVINRRFCRVHEGGEISEIIDVDGAAVACALGGPDRRRLHMLVAPGTHPDEVAGKGAGRILTVEVDVAGAGLP